MDNMLNTFNIIPVKDKVPTSPWSEYFNRKQTKEERENYLKSKEIGIVTGKVSNIFVLDDDGGLDLSKYHLPKTYTQKTPRGGTHYLFKWIPELDNKVTTRTNIMDKVDVRGHGGYIKYYGFDKKGVFTLSFPPKWLIDLLPNKIKDNVLNKRDSVTSINNIQEGNRNDSFTRLAGSLRAKGYNEDEIFDLLESKANDVNFPLSELKLVCKSVSRYEPKVRVNNDVAEGLESFLEDEQKVEWIIPGLIARNSIGFVAGLPETGKTWTLIDLAISLSVEDNKDVLWLGKFNIVKHPLKVLFIDQERFKGETQRRFKAVIKGKGLTPKNLQNNLYIKCGTTTRLDLQHSFEAFRKELCEIKPDIVMVDSFATFHTKEENSRKDIQEVLEKIKELRNEFGCTFLFIHHENKNAFNKGDDADEPSIAQMAGNVAIPASAETVLTVRKHNEGTSMIYHTKSTLSSTEEPFLVRVIDNKDDKSEIIVQAH